MYKLYTNIHFIIVYNAIKYGINNIYIFHIVCMIVNTIYTYEKQTYTYEKQTYTYSIICIVLSNINNIQFLNIR